MEDEHEQVSLHLHDLLCKVIGSEDVIQTRRSMFFVEEIISDSKWARQIPSGSKAEGLDMEGSDYDIMFLLKAVQVFENTTDIRINNDPNKTISCVMEQDSTKPGFTRLKLVENQIMDYEPMYWLSKISELFGDALYISSEKIHTHDTHGELMPTESIHGPCVIFEGGDLEYLYCFRCYKWITIVSPWISRARGAWPCPYTIKKITDYGVLFVPVGCKNSKYEDLEWRISFSVAEKDLIYSFNHTQMLCYAALKIFLTDIIKPKHGELLCSYFLKTIMFWLAEEIDQSYWIPTNLIWCIRQCLKRLMYCVEYKICLHYFIPEINFFEDRFTDSEQRELLNTLKEIRDSEPGSPLIMQIKTIQNYIQCSLWKGTMFSTAMPILSITTAQLLGYPSENKNLLLHRIIKTSGLYDSSITKLMQLFVSKSYARWAGLPDEYSSHTNKRFYRQYKEIMCYLSIGLSSDAVGGWCTLATVLYNSKQYTKCRTALSYSLSKCTPDKIMFSLDPYLSRSNSTLLCKKFFTKAVTHFCIRGVEFQSGNNLPIELKSLPSLFDPNPWVLIEIPVVVYLHLLDSLCAFHLGNYMDMMDSVRCLEIVIRERFFMFSSENQLQISHQCLSFAKDLLNRTQ